MPSSRRRSRRATPIVGRCSCCSCCSPSAVPVAGWRVAEPAAAAARRTRSSCRSSPAPPRARSPSSGSTPGSRCRRGCCTNISAFPAMRAASAPAATRSIRRPRRAGCFRKMVRGDETLGHRAADRGLDLPPVPRRTGASADSLKPTTAGMTDERDHGRARRTRRGAGRALLSRHLCLQQGQHRPGGAQARPPRDAVTAGRGLGAARAPDTPLRSAGRPAQAGVDRREGDRPGERPRQGGRRLHQPAAHLDAAADRPDRDLRPGRAPSTATCARSTC